MECGLKTCEHKGHAETETGVNFSLFSVFLQSSSRKLCSLVTLFTGIV